MVSTLKKVKKDKGYTNQDIADLSGVPISTVERVFGNKPMNFQYETLQPIIDLLLDDDNSSISPEDNVEFMRAVIRQLNALLLKEKEEYQERLERVKAEKEKEFEKSFRSFFAYRVGVGILAVIAVLFGIVDFSLLLLIYKSLLTILSN